MAPAISGASSAPAPPTFTRCRAALVIVIAFTTTAEGQGDWSDWGSISPDMWLPHVALSTGSWVDDSGTSVPRDCFEIGPAVRARLRTVSIFLMAVRR